MAGKRPPSFEQQSGPLPRRIAAGLHKIGLAMKQQAWQQANEEKVSATQGQILAGLRHHRAKKNQTDGAASTELVPFRNLLALVFPVTFTLRPFLAKNGHSPEDVEKMHAAWVKSCLLQVTLWSHPYIKDGDF